jgi:hypothetical protein
MTQPLDLVLGCVSGSQPSLKLDNPFYDWPAVVGFVIGNSSITS